MRKTSVKISLGLLVSISIINVCSAAGSFEAACNRRKVCNSTVGLRCLKGRCQCVNPDAQLFSETLGACAIKIGRRCGTNDELQVESDSGRPINEEENSTVDLTLNNSDSLCVPNAECRKIKLRKWCRCKEGFMPNGQGSACVPVAKYNETCSPLGTPCEKSSGTQCINERCICPFGNQQFFDQQERKCVSYANGNCTVPKVSACVKNAECLSVQLRTGFTSEDGVKKIHTKSVTQCHCVKGYSETKEGFCYPMANTKCSSKPSESCNLEAFLVCVDGKCKCRNPLHEQIDEETGACMRLVGSTGCESQGNTTTMSCVRNSECLNNTCTCKSTYTPTPQKTCLLSYKQPCEAYQCGTSLACINGICECFDSHLIYSETENTCVGLSSSGGE